MSANGRVPELWRSELLCVGVHVHICEGGRADELHFLLVAVGSSPARSPINRLKDKDVREK